MAMERFTAAFLATHPELPADEHRPPCYNVSTRRMEGTAT